MIDLITPFPAQAQVENSQDRSRNVAKLVNYIIRRTIDFKINIYDVLQMNPNHFPVSDDLDFEPKEEWMNVQICYLLCKSKTKNLPLLL